MVPSYGWNLPRRDKMVPARYQDILASAIPEARGDDGQVTVRVIAGESLGAHASIETRTPVICLYAIVQSEGRLLPPVHPSFNTVAYIAEGVALFYLASVSARIADIARFEQRDLVEVMVRDGAGPLSVILIAGAPLGGPVVS